MDTSKEYIKMCKKAKEIQERKQSFEEGDVYININGKFIFCLKCTSENSKRYIYDTMQVVWLPRQDQLQEMMNYKPKDNPVSFLCMFGNWVIHTSNTDYGWENRNYWENTFKTMEQLTLGMVMWVKHQKKWDGENWS